MTTRTTRYGSVQARIAARSFDSAEWSFEGTPCRMWDGPVVKSKRSGNYYPRMSVWVPALHAHRSVRVHREIFELHYGVRLGEHQCNHRCGNTLCVNPLHLEKVTHSQNMKDRDKRRKEKAQCQTSA